MCCTRLRRSTILYALSTMLFTCMLHAGDVFIQEGRLVPRLMNYQGYLTDTLGIPITDNLDMTFKIFDAVSSGNELWSEALLNVPVERGVFSVILGGNNPIPDSVFADFTSTWLELTLEGPQTLTPRTRITAVGYAYTSVYSDTAEYARIAASDNDWTLNDDVLYPSGDFGLSMRSGNMLYGAHDSTHVNLGVACTTGLSGQNRKYCAVAGGYGNAASGGYATIAGGRENAASSLYPAVVGGYSNTASASYAFVGGGFGNTGSHIYSTVGGGYGNIADGERAVVAGGWNNHASGYLTAVDGGYGNTASGNYAVVDGGYVDSARAVYSGVFCGYSNLAGDSIIDTAATIAGGYNNAVREKYAFVGGGWQNTASGIYAVVSGGGNNTANNLSTTVGGGLENIASGLYASVGGGAMNTANGISTVVSGGSGNSASGAYASVAGGTSNAATVDYAALSGGYENTASGYAAFVGGGYQNVATGDFATVAGGFQNRATIYGTIPGGYRDTVTAWDALAANYSTRADHQRSAAFTTCHTTASDQVRGEEFVSGTLVFTMDHPSDPMNKILNQHAVGSNEAILVYNGTAYIEENGLVAVTLPEYFDEINKNARIQLTGVGTYEIYVAEKINGNRFVIGGKPGTEVYWTVTGARTDVHAEIARMLTPVEQRKTGKLVAHSLDDDALIGTYDQLQKEKPGMFTFKTDEGRRAYEEYGNRGESRQ